MAHAPSATLGGRKLGTIGLAGAFSFFSNKILAIGEGGLLATDDDDVAALARSRRSHAMTSGTWDRHSGRTDTYDVTDLGFNYRLDEPRSALALSRLPRLEADIERRRGLVRGYREAAGLAPDCSCPSATSRWATSSCYVMPVMVRDPERRDAFRDHLLRAPRRADERLLSRHPRVHRLPRAVPRRVACRARSWPRAARSRSRSTRT